MILIDTVDLNSYHIEQVLEDRPHIIRFDWNTMIHHWIMTIGLTNTEFLRGVVVTPKGFLLYRFHHLQNIPNGDFMAFPLIGDHITSDGFHLVYFTGTEYDRIQSNIRA